jgi:hypothetical protein
MHAGRYAGTGADRWPLGRAPADTCTARTQATASGNNGRSEAVQAVRAALAPPGVRRPLRFQVPGGVADHVQDEVGVRQHRDVAAVDVVGPSAHALSGEAFQVGVHGPVVIGDDVPARLGLPRTPRAPRPGGWG